MEKTNQAFEAVELNGVEFDWSRVGIVVHRRPWIELNGAMEQLEESDYEDIHQFGLGPYNLEPILAMMIEADSDNEIDLQRYFDATVARDRWFLKWRGAPRVRYGNALEYIYDSMQAILDKYQNPPKLERVEATTAMKWHKLRIPRRD